MIANVQAADADDVDVAVAAANAAFKLGSEWREADASYCRDCLLKLADQLRKIVNTWQNLKVWIMANPYMLLISSTSICPSNAFVTTLAGQIKSKVKPSQLMENSLHIHAMNLLEYVVKLSLEFPYLDVVLEWDQR